jgi:hypothetical protein
MYKGLSWSIGMANYGPADGMTYLATGPASGSYPDLANDWAMLPVIDLSPYTSCQFRITAEVWRNAEKYGLINYDGGNLQYTLDPAGATGWMLVGGSAMAYDGILQQCAGNCVVYNQQVWTSGANPKWRTAIYEGAVPGPQVRFRFTFASDLGQMGGPWHGIYVRRLQVDVF